MSLPTLSDWGYPPLTEEQARQIRKWRCEVGLTWRGVAWHFTGFTDDHQLLGMDLCNQAAERLGEDPNADPWN